MLINPLPSFSSTAFYATERIGQKIKSKELTNIICIPTSEATKTQVDIINIITIIIITITIIITAIFTIIIVLLRFLLPLY